MTLQHITFSPTICKCVIEFQYEDTDNPPENTLWFFHNVCSKHEPLVKNKPKLSDNTLKQKRDIISSHHQKLLSDNKINNLKHLDEDPNRVQKANTAKELIKSMDTEQLGLKIEADLQEEKRKIETILDNHADNSMQNLIIGIYSPYAFIAGQEVLDAINQESKQFELEHPNTDTGG